MDEGLDSKDDLEWLLTRLGWKELCWAIDDCLGYHPDGDPCENFVPRYDRDVNLMIELVEKLDESQLDDWVDFMADLYSTYLDAPDFPSWMAQASAARRLQAYRAVMEGN